MTAPVPTGPQWVYPEPRSAHRGSTLVTAAREPPMRKCPCPAAIIAGEPITGLSRIRSSGPASARRRAVLGATVLTSANTAEGSSDASTPSGPRQTSRTAESSANTTSTASAPTAASPVNRPGERPRQRRRRPDRASGSRRATWWPFSSALVAKARPMFPMPTTAIRTPASVLGHIDDRAGACAHSVRIDPWHDRSH